MVFLKIADKNLLVQKIAEMGREFGEEKQHDERNEVLLILSLVGALEVFV